MSYHLRWRLVGRGNRLLDRGEIDSGFADRTSAIQALAAFLQQFAQWGRADEEGSWWARRSPDADLRVQISLRDESMALPDRGPAVWTARQDENVPLRS